MIAQDSRVDKLINMKPESTEQDQSSVTLQPGPGITWGAGLRLCWAEDQGEDWNP